MEKTNKKKSGDFMNILIKLLHRLQHLHFINFSYERNVNKRKYNFNISLFFRHSYACCCNETVIGNKVYKAREKIFNYKSLMNPLLTNI